MHTSTRNSTDPQSCLSHERVGICWLFTCQFDTVETSTHLQDGKSENSR